MKISFIIFIGFSVILVLFSITTYVNYRQSQVVNEDLEWVSNSQLIIRHTSRFQRNIVEMQSNLRGFLLTGEPLFLVPYQAAVTENADLGKELLTLIPDSSDQKQELKDIQQYYFRWQQEFANPLIAARKNVAISDSAEHAFTQLQTSQLRSQTEQAINDQIREKFKEFNNYEYTLRSKRKENLNASVANTRYISLSLTSTSILIGLAIALYITFIISKRIRHMVDLADRLAKGNFKMLIEDKANDELSHLSQSLNGMARILDENISELERKNQELDRFAYVVSHDLKAPLRGIENASSWIEEDFGDKLPAKVKEYLSMMRGRVRRMENLIGGILELSRIGKGKKRVEKVNLKHLVKEIVEMISPGPAMQITIQADLPTIHTERIPLQQILTNLISNAVKYHNRENGHISIRYRELEKHYEFTVSDDGPGIEPRYHEKIFIIFQTLQERDAIESTGVGLAIVKKILEDKKCSIQVVSDVGKGAAFTFTWPKIETNSSERVSDQISAQQWFRPVEFT
jgi:signal transduction histidine kinase